MKFAFFCKIVIGPNPRGQKERKGKDEKDEEGGNDEGDEDLGRLPDGFLNPENLPGGNRGIHGRTRQDQQG